MSQHNDPKGERTAEQEAEQPFRLDHEIARRYDPSRLSQLIVREAGRGEPLDQHTRSQMERRLGGNFSSVRIFRGPLAEEVTSRYRADAVTVGGTEMILVREGWQSNFQSAEGHALLAHELTHVRQQQQGLYFHSSAYGDPNSAMEAPAHAVQDFVKAELEGGMDLKRKKKKDEEERKFLERVRQRARQKYEEIKENLDLRGSVNEQSNVGANGQHG